ncbi:hypothetical protein A0J61_09513 [Choanephora cucurbitarum]|uniref:Uncharacterized protein n=1 Tax=Choanephora cucurbitarum TaxID=101091 RepID=A0A1C7N007_9FUNG|nr:hypothetical protein A0J61_09513 [Choanephora cucurbitarum]
MTELSLIQAWIIILTMALIFLSGLCWCFCCGTCVGRSLLRNTGLMRFTRGANTQWQRLPHKPEDENSWQLMTRVDDEESQTQ